MFLSRWCGARGVYSFVEIQAAGRGALDYVGQTNGGFLALEPDVHEIKLVAKKAALAREEVRSAVTATGVEDHDLPIYLKPTSKEAAKVLVPSYTGATLPAVIKFSQDALQDPPDMMTVTMTATRANAPIEMPISRPLLFLGLGCGARSGLSRRAGLP